LKDDWFLAFPKKTAENPERISAVFLKCVLCLFSNFYMVHDHLWDEFGVRENYLCWNCFEKRLGRELTKEDFTDAKCNVKANPNVKILLFG
jgi:hypothetical protein